MYNRLQRTGAAVALVYAYYNSRIRCTNSRIYHFDYNEHYNILQYIYIFPSPVSAEPHKIRISPRTRCGTTCYYPQSARLSPNTVRGAVAKNKI